MSNWQQYFIQVGKNGSDNYRIAMIKGINEIANSFEVAVQPYSGVDPMALQEAIYRLRLDQEIVTTLDTVIEETIELVVKNSIVVQHPHCIAHLHTPPLISAIVAESFIAAQNQSMDSWDQSAAATYVENHVINWLCRLFGYDHHYDGVFTSGGTQSNIMALLMARDKASEMYSGHDTKTNGLPEYASKYRILCSEKTHFSVTKAAAVMGLGEKSVVCVATHADGTIDVNALAEIIVSMKSTKLIPFVIVGTAGTTDHGAVDDLLAISHIAKLHGIWFHVDAAYGGALVLSQSKHRLVGIEQADSMTVDFHKLWFQPVSCSAVLLKDKSSFKYMLHHADYLNRESDDLPNLVDKSISTTRRFDALKVFMTLRTVGADTLGKMVDHLLKQTQEVADLIDQRNELVLIARPTLSTVLFRYVGENALVDDNEFNRRLRVHLLRTGVAILGETTVAGMVTLKLTILNPCLTLLNFSELLDKIVDVAKNM
jgi:glutamate/tyrosine decarboxylase-like PLP-dependent enzyme